MTIHTNQPGFACYTRKTPRHYWMLTLTASNKAALCASLRLDFKDYGSAYQHAWTSYQAGTIDDLPRDAAVNFVATDFSNAPINWEQIKAWYHVGDDDNSIITDVETRRILTESGII